MSFVADQGQVDERVAFYTHTFGGTCFVTKKGEIVYALPHGKTGSMLALRERFQGGVVDKVRAGLPSPTSIIYFHGKERSAWRTAIDDCTDASAVAFSKAC